MPLGLAVAAIGPWIARFSDLSEEKLVIWIFTVNSHKHS